MSNKENLKTFGPLNVKEEGDYGSISSHGPCSASVPFSADTLKVNGPFVAVDEVVVKEAKINGPVRIEGSAEFTKLKINGPSVFQGELLISSNDEHNSSAKASFNGPLTVEEGITGSNMSQFKINGPIKAKYLKEAEKVKISGPVNLETIENVRTLKIRGQTTVNTIEVKEDLVIDLAKNESQIGTITATNVEIGQGISGEGNGGVISGIVRSFTKSTGTAVINEINASGKVELDNVTVNKIVAKEVYAGENTEIGEFIELTV